MSTLVPSHSAVHMLHERGKMDGLSIVHIERTMMMAFLKAGMSMNDLIVAVVCKVRLQTVKYDFLPFELLEIL